MRPIPAQRIGHAHGLLKALDQRGTLRLEELASALPEAELVPPGVENGTGRLRQFVSYARAAALLNEESGVLSLSDLGRRYIRSADKRDVFAVSHAQAESLRRQLREKHLTSSIWNGAAIALSLFNSLPEGDWVSLTDLGRAAAHVGGTGWDDDNTFLSQGERLTFLLQDLNLLSAERLLTGTGHDTIGDLSVPDHPPLKDLAAQLHPGGADGAAMAAAVERADLGLGPAPAAATAVQAADPPPDQSIEAPEVVAFEAGDEVDSHGPPVAEPASAPEPEPTPEPAPEPEPEPEPAPAPEPEPIAGPDEPTRSLPKAPMPIAGAAAGIAGSSVSEEAAPVLTAPVPTPPAPAPPPAPAAPEPPTIEPAAASAFQSGIRPRTAITLIRPADLETWKAAQEAAAEKPAPSTKKAPPGFLDLAEVRSAAERRGLVIDAGVYAAAVAALASGRHLVLTGGAGSGKTSLALALGEAAAARGHCASVLFTSAGSGFSTGETLGRRDRQSGEFAPGIVPRAIAENRWLVIDELDRVRLDRALGRLSTVLGGQAIDLPDGGRLAPGPGWRVIATMADIDAVGHASPALRRRFVFVEVPVLERQDLEQLVGTWAGDDEVAASVGRRLVAVNDVVPLGPGLYKDAVAYARSRRQLEPVEEADLTLEALAGFVLPQIEGLGDDVAARAVAAAGLAG